MSSTNFDKPAWYDQLPHYYKPKQSKIGALEKLRISFGMDNNSFASLISIMPWGVRKLQLFMFEKFRGENPHLSQKDLWKAVIHSRMNVKKWALDIPPPPFARPLKLEEINSILNNLENIISDFNSFDDVIEYIIEIDRKEGWFWDSSRRSKELNALLEGE